MNLNALRLESQQYADKYIKDYGVKLTIKINNEDGEFISVIVSGELVNDTDGESRIDGLREFSSDLGYSELLTLIKDEIHYVAMDVVEDDLRNKGLLDD